MNRSVDEYPKGKGGCLRYVLLLFFRGSFKDSEEGYPEPIYVK